MKKTIAAALTATAATALFTAVPAQAGTDKVTICHATSASNGGYVLNEVDKSSITKQGHGDHAGDIIPAFSWVDEDRVRQYFDGANLDKLSILANGCKKPAEQSPAAPVAPVYVPASCSRPTLPYGEVVIPKDLGPGVVGASSAYAPDNATITVSYTLAAPTEERVYTWPAGVTGNYTFTIVPITEDPYYVVDSKTGVGQCELPETGATDYVLPLTSGALIIGVGTAALIANRRKGN